MAATSKTRTGFFLIADITGYTSFVTGTEAEHAQEIVEDLTKLLLRHIVTPFKLVKLEGDALFYYAPAEMLPEAERLLEHIESCYTDFVSHVQNMELHTTCPCRACSSMTTLDLKFFVHYGEFMVQNVPGTAEDIVGRDVILLHRLLKNTVTEKMGLRGYALITEACIVHMGEISALTLHTENYDHIGDVACRVYDLGAYEQKARETRRVYLEAKDADYIFERTLIASPDLLWSFIIDPKRRLLWENIKEVKNKRNADGRLGVDAEFHCNHGSYSRLTKMVDWRPFSYMTNVTIQTFHALPFRGPACQGMFEFIPVDAERTKLSFRLRSLKRDRLTMFVVRNFMKAVLDKEYITGLGRLEKILKEIQCSHHDTE